MNFETRKYEFKLSSITFYQWSIKEHTLYDLNSEIIKICLIGQKMAHGVHVYAWEEWYSAGLGGTFHEYPLNLIGW